MDTVPSLSEILMIDIETVSHQADFEELTPEWQFLFEKKTKNQRPPDVPLIDWYRQQAAIFAEFGKIICISLGYFGKRNQTERFLKVKSIYGNNEQKLLIALVESIQKFEQQHPNLVFCGHNIREFDIPYINRRLLINNLAIPRPLDFQLLKPWQVPLLDTLQLWKFGDHKHYTSLALLAACFGIQSPKMDMDGSQVGITFWEEANLPKIAHYCEGDVVTCANLLLKLRQLPLLAQAQIETADPILV